MYRGARPAHDPLPAGERQDTRKHTRHCLRPDTADVTRYLGDPGEAAWKAFASRYRALLERRFREDRAPFDRLAEQARDGDVYLGCSCPTRKNPDVRRCHTTLALRFMQQRYDQLEVVLPEAPPRD